MGQSTKSTNHMSNPIVTVWRWSQGGLSGTSPADEREFAWAITAYGHAITTVGSKPSNHYICGIGVGHQDAEFCESRGGQSMAAYGENGEAYGGRWWEDDGPFSDGVKYYGCVDRWPHRSKREPARRTPESAALAARAGRSRP